MPETISDKQEKFIFLVDAAKLCLYSQEYLSLRARQGKLKATKVGRNWVTTEEWLEEYVKENSKFQIPNSKQIPKTEIESINWQSVFQKVGYGFLILLLGFGLLKVSPNIINWTADGIADVSQWLIETGKALEQQADKISSMQHAVCSMQGIEFAPASLLDNLLDLDLAMLTDKTKLLVDYSLEGGKISVQNIKEGVLHLAQKISQNDHKVQATVLAEANRTLGFVQFAPKKIAKNAENISRGVSRYALRGLGFSLRKVGQAGQITSKTVARAKQPIYNLEAGIIANFANLQRNIKGWENSVERKIVNGAKGLVNFLLLIIMRQNH